VGLQIPCSFNPEEEKESTIRSFAEAFRNAAPRIGEAKKGCEFVEGNLIVDHVHMCISIPPKYSMANVVGFIKGKSAISIARNFRGKTKNFAGENFWARGYFVSTVGLDEDMMRNYIRVQEAEDERYEQLCLWKS